MPTPSRAAFIIANIARMPLCFLPTSQPFESSKLMTQVDEALMPILCSIEPQRTPLAGPASTPLAPFLGRNFGTRKSEMPLMPGGASGSFASTRWTMFSVRSCSPAEMKIFVPVMRNETVIARPLVGRHGLRLDHAEIGAAMRLGQAHRARPGAVGELRQIGVLELLVACSSIAL